MSTFRRLLISSSPTSNSDQGSTPDPQKTPLIIVNLKISPDAKTLAPKNIKRSEKKLPPYCVQFQNTTKSTNETPHPSPSMKVIQDFIVQGTLIGNQRRQLAAHASKNSPNIIINCDDSEYDECDTYAESTLNMFQNINSDLLLSLDYYEMDSLGRLPGDSRTPTPIQKASLNRPSSASQLSQARSITPTTLVGVPAGYRPLGLRSVSPTAARTVLRVDLQGNSDNYHKTESAFKDINYNIHRLNIKRGIRNKNDKLLKFG
ncbi:hypothetical protein ACKWTF_010271 [Chironomus riparius]